MEVPRAVRAADATYLTALDAHGAEPSRLRARALWARAYLLVYGGRFDEALTIAGEALELQVVNLAGQGLTNPEIAARMFVSRGTVKVHLSHIYTKLDVRNWSELAALTAKRATVTSQT